MSPIPRSPLNGSLPPRRRGRTHPSVQRSHLIGGRMFDVGHFTTHRRGFLGRIAASAAAFGLGGLVAPFTATAEPTATAGKASANPEFEAWLNKITGRHKMVYDIPEPNGGVWFAWGRGFLHTNKEKERTTDTAKTGALVLRHHRHPLFLKSGE